MAAVGVAAALPLLHGGADGNMLQRTQCLQELQQACGCSQHHLEHDLLVASLIQLMTGNFDLVLAYLLWKKSKQSSRTSSGIEDIIRSLWLHLFDDETFCMRCCVELLDGPSRVRAEADRFAMESIIVERIMQSARRGVAMPLGQVIDEFLGLWFRRTTISAVLELWIVRLAYHRNTRRKFGVRLRAVWQLHIGSLRTVTPTAPTLGREKACA